MRATNFLWILCFSLLAAACDDGGRATAVYPLKQGTVLTLKAFGQHYESEVIRVEDGYSAWKTEWGDHQVGWHKEYKGILVVSGREGKVEFFNKFDTGLIDQLFPLKAGAETSISGVNHNEKSGAQQPFWTHIMVRGEDSIELKSGEWPVYIIDVTTDTKTADGTERSEKTMWYSPDFGISLKSEYRRGEEYFQVRILDVTPPDGATDPTAPSRRSLGTVMI